MDIIYASKLAPNAFIPVKLSTESVGFEIHAQESVTILPNSIKAVKTGICLQIPQNYYGEIISVNNVVVFPGVIDSDFQGEIMVLVLNYGSEQPKRIREGDTIGRILITEIHPVQVLKEDGKDASSMNHRQRGSAGFGSTGK